MKNKKVIMVAISIVIVVLVIIIGIAIGRMVKAKWDSTIGSEIAKWRGQASFQLENFMKEQSYELDTYKKIDFNEDDIVDIVATGVKGSKERQEWALFLINGVNNEVTAFETGEVWYKGHRLEIKKVKDTYHIIYNHTKEYGESKVYEITPEGILKKAVISGNYYRIEKLNDNRLSITYENGQFEQVFNISTEWYDKLPDQFSFNTRGVSYYFEDNYLVTDQTVSFPDLYETAGFSMKTYFEWQQGKWQLTQVIYSGGPEFTLADEK